MQREVHEFFPGWYYITYNVYFDILAFQTNVSALPEGMKH